MATLFESHTTGDDAAAYIGAGNNWRAQTFMPSIAHTISSVKLLMYRLSGTPGTITIRIRATDSSGLPTGDDLTTGTTDGDTLTESTAGEWREITLTPYTLAVNTKYGIIVTAGSQSGNDVVYVRWRDDGTDGYTDGAAEFSSDGGSSWDEEVATRDLMFAEYGAYQSGELSGLIAIVEERLHYVDAFGAERYDRFPEVV